ncbi:ABC transporter ATP-binding protein [Roseovarius sp. Pro17]|uniref:ABC transporter ATP-binding protein n=1 Tax=Roseovarius sp. Pro17 TaxID=3108175 RepID=UPI002D791490|nr:ATP-binding cassette domain-containing protein [Roseovarius sp. Pro17]
MLELSDIHVEIAGAPVLRSVSFALEPGKATILIGRNGAGKTTTLRTIMGLIKASRGEIRIDGERLDQMPAHARAGHGIGYAPEDRRLIPEFTVEDNILLPALALKVPSAKRATQLEEVYDFLPELKKMRSRSGGGVSGGQGKMVALGRALMLARKVLMLDEPFQGLAPALALDYARTLSRLRDAKPEIAILITESSPHLLKAVADVTLMIERGKVEVA